MFQVKIASRDIYDIVIELDADSNLWCFIKFTSNGNVFDAASIWPLQGPTPLKTFGTVEKFIDGTVIPKTNALLEKVFGKVAPPPEDADPMDKLEYLLQTAVAYDAATNKLVRK